MGITHNCIPSSKCNQTGLHNFPDLPDLLSNQPLLFHGFQPSSLPEPTLNLDNNLNLTRMRSHRGPDCSNSTNINPQPTPPNQADKPGR